jgi:hypothetical protein
MTPARLREKLNTRPFQPFRVFLSDGSHCDVPHPEFAWVWGARLFVGVAARNGNAVDAPMRELSILHVTRLEDLPQRKPKK